MDDDIIAQLAEIVEAEATASTQRRLRKCLEHPRTHSVCSAPDDLMARVADAVIVQARAATTALRNLRSVANPPEEQVSNLDYDQY